MAQRAVLQMRRRLRRPPPEVWTSVPCIATTTPPGIGRQCCTCLGRDCGLMDKPLTGGMAVRGGCCCSSRGGGHSSAGSRRIPCARAQEALAQEGCEGWERRPGLPGRPGAPGSARLEGRPPHAWKARQAPQPSGHRMLVHGRAGQSASPCRLWLSYLVQAKASELLPPKVGSVVAWSTVQCIRECGGHGYT